MRIGIEGATWANRRGFGRFTRQLVTALVRTYPRHEWTLMIDEHGARQCTFPEALQIALIGTREQATLAASAGTSRSIGDIWRSSRAVARQEFDVFFFPTRYTFYPLFCDTPTVVAFHDGTAERHPELIFPSLVQRTLWRAKSWLALRQADQLVTVSQGARRQIAEAFSLAPSSIRVITEGPDPVFGPRDVGASDRSVRARYGLPPEMPLVLYVGGISPHKNLDGLLHAMRRLLDAGVSGWHVVLVGDFQGDSFLGCHDELVALTAELGLDGRVTFTGYMPDEDLVLVYNMATLLVLPSMGEGFGLPVVEALTCGLPVAVSDRGSLPEVVGEAGVIFDPTSHDDMARRIGQLLGDEERRRSLRAAGLERAREFSWDMAARKLMEILEEVAARGR